MEELTVSLSENTTFIAKFSWKEHQLKPVVKNDHWEFDFYGGIIEEWEREFRGFGYRRGYHMETFEKVVMETSDEFVFEKDFEIKGNASKTIGGNCLFELAFQNKTAKININGNLYAFHCKWKENGEDQNTIVLHMTLSDKEKITFTTDEDLKESEKLKILVKKRNDDLLVEVRKEIEVRRLKEEYERFSFIKKWFGGESLKEKHHVS